MLPPLPVKASEPIKMLFYIICVVIGQKPRGDDGVGLWAHAQGRPGSSVTYSSALICPQKIQTKTIAVLVEVQVLANFPWFWPLDMFLPGVLVQAQLMAASWRRSHRKCTSYPCSHTPHCAIVQVRIRVPRPRPNLVCTETKLDP